MKSFTCYFILSLIVFIVSAQNDPETTTITPETTTITPETTTITPETTTITPETTTTTPETSTTTTPKTTTSTTTTPETTTTQPKPTTTSPPPPNVDYFSIMDGNTTCIMLKGNFKFTVTYALDGKNNTTNKTTVSVPKPTDKVDFKIDGTCNGNGSEQYIEVAWGGDTLTKSSIKLIFNSTDGKNWEIIKFSAVIPIDKKHFPNSSIAGKSLESEVTLDFNPKEIPFNHSYICSSESAAVNVTTTLENIDYIYPVHFNMESVKIQAFNKIPGTKDFVEATHCQMDKVADIVPIAVGCALFALVLFVAIAYIVGRRRRNAAYQSV